MKIQMIFGIGIIWNFFGGDFFLKKNGLSVPPFFLGAKRCYGKASHDLVK